jgi:hypothetical protein
MLLLILSVYLRVYVLERGKLKVKYILFIVGELSTHITINTSEKNISAAVKLKF